MAISTAISSVGRKLLSGSVLGVVQLVATAIVSFLLMSFIVHHFGDRIYGFWSLAAAFIGYYGLLDLGLSSAVSQYICTAIGRKDPAECNAVFNTALRIQLLFGGIALLATVVIAGATPWFCRDPIEAHLFRRVIAILGVTAAIGFPTRVYAGLLDAELRFDIQSWLGILGLALRTGLTVWAVLAGGGLMALAWMSLLATLPMTALQIWFARREAPWAKIEVFSVERKRVKSLFSYSVYTFVTMIANALRLQIDPLVISAFVGLAAVTHYRIASVFMSYYINLIISSTSMFQPLLSRLHGAGDRSGLERVFFFATKVSLCISVFIGFSLVFWGKPFISRWMGAKYEDAYWPMAVLSLAVFLDVGQSPSINLLFATFKHRAYTYVNLAEGIVNLLVSLALVRPLGILGVALGTLVAAVLIRIVVQPFVVCSASGLHYGDYVKFLGGTLLRCGCLAGAAIAVSSWGLRPSYPYLISSAICATVLYAGGSWLIVFTEREREHLLAALTNRSLGPIEPATAGALVS